MNKIIYSLIATLFLFTSCLDENPMYTANSNIIYSSQASAQMALNGIYGMMAVQGSFAQLVPEINTEASGLCWTAYNASDNRTQYTAGHIPVANEFNDLVWGALYQAIANCNVFVKSCEGATFNGKDNMVAQAKFLRGVCYYTLLDFYGGVPLRLEPSTIDNINMPRASRQEVIDQIVKDWTESIDGLNTTSALASTPTAPNKYSAYAYLTKLYWKLGCNAWACEQGDGWSATLKASWPEMKTSKSYFETAQTYGDLVLASGPFDLEPNFKTLFNGERLPFSKEFVFVINATASTTENVGYNSLSWTFSPQNSTPGESWGRSQPNKSFYDWAHGTYQDDARLKATFVSRWTKYVNNAPSSEIQTSYPYVAKSVNDTTWIDSIVRPGRPPVKWPIIKVVRKIIDSIDYRIGGKYLDPTNPQLSELDSLIKDSYCRTKGGSDWNINDWPYFGKYMTTHTSGRYADNNLYVYRYADFLLLMADVYNELDNKSKAVELVNKVLLRARNSSKPVASVYPKDWSTSLTKEQVRQQIFDERLFELAAEFDSWNDTRRRGIAWRKNILLRNNNHAITKACHDYGVAHNYIAPWREYWYPEGVEDWDSYLVRNQLIPIPRTEMNTNNKITLTDQNPGY